eukprot:13705765-Alexandrium_andersonii.AAC.1
MGPSGTGRSDLLVWSRLGLRDPGRSLAKDGPLQHQHDLLADLRPLGHQAGHGARDLRTRSPETDG